MSFKRVFEHGCSKCPQLMPKNTHVIREWLAAGYDAEKDIIPAIDYKVKFGARTIQSWGFFTHAIQYQHEKRLKAQIQAKAPEPTKEQLMKSLAWKRARNGFLTDSQEQSLKQWEAEHGPL